MSRRLAGPAIVVLVVLFATIAVARILLTYGTTSQAFDEPCHVAAGVELIGKGTYTLDPVHPPLSRWAIGLPLYLAGERYPLTGAAARSDDYNVVGNSILYGSGHYQRNLRLARLGVLPFFLLAILVVFIWARREFGNFSAVAAVALFTTLPIVLAFSSIAYTDIAAASTQGAALFCFASWLEKRTTRSTLLLGLALGLAISAKFTTLLFFFAAASTFCLARWLFGRKTEVFEEIQFGLVAKQLVLALFVAGIFLWGSYRFAIGHVREDMLPARAPMPSFQNFPAPLRGPARYLVLSNPAVPDPALMKGLGMVWVLNHQAPDSYLLGKIKPGGWWYFFLVGIAVKSPIPFLILAAVGTIASYRLARTGQWTALTPSASVFAILVVTMPVKYNAGVRHVLVVFLLLALVAGYGCRQLWNNSGKGASICRLVLVLLLLWQAAATWHARSDYLAYFNELGGKDPSRILVMGCDLDCGQDVFRLSQELRARKISQVTLALWSSADIARADLPPFAVALPSQPAVGWFAISLRALRMGDVLHKTYPPNAFAWLSQYQPVTQIGKTILLYYIPDRATTTPKAELR
jgi:Dolichyl-phosphate-mannose-protein mannosyltransferase